MSETSKPVRLLHLSDLHFGAETPALVEALLAECQSLKPDLIVISGDFAQIGSADEFKMAKAFIDNLCAPVFCVPGNHDVPARNLLERFLDPYEKYETYINAEKEPVLRDDRYILAGVNTARRALPHWNWANGAICDEQLSRVKDVFGDDDAKYRICVMHHPIHKAEESPLKVTVFGSRAAMKVIQDCKVDLVLTGHVHHASVTEYGHTVFVSASTAISNRLRGDGNGFNVIDLYDEFFEIAHLHAEGHSFSETSRTRIVKKH